MRSVETGARLGLVGGMIVGALQSDGRQPQPSLFNKMQSTPLALQQQPVDYGSLIVDTRNIETSSPPLETHSFFDTSEQVVPSKRLALVVTPGIGTLDATTHPFYIAINEKLFDPTHPLNMDLYRVLPDNPSDPEANSYVRKIQQQIDDAGKKNEKVVLLGYSHGARAMVLLLNSLIDKNDKNYRPDLADHVLSVVLLAPRNNDMNNWNKRDSKTYPNYAGFYVQNLSSQPESTISSENLNQINKRFGKMLVVITGKDDQVVSFVQSEGLARELGGYLIEREALGNHFGTKESGDIVAGTLLTIYKAWLASEEMKRMLKKSGVSKVDLLRQQAHTKPTPGYKKYNKPHREQVSPEMLVFIRRDDSPIAA